MGAIFAVFRQLSGSLWRCARQCVAALSGIPLENRGVLVRSALSCFFIFGSSTGASKAAAQGICQRISWKITALSSSYYWPFGIRDDIIEWKMTSGASSFPPAAAWRTSTPCGTVGITTIPRRVSTIYKAGIMILWFPGLSTRTALPPQAMACLAIICLPTAGTIRSVIATRLDISRLWMIFLYCLVLP